MSLKKKAKRIIIIISAIIMTGIIGYLIVNTEKEVDNTQYLPTESILKNKLNWILKQVSVMRYLILWIKLILNWRFMLI